LEKLTIKSAISKSPTERSAPVAPLTLRQMKHASRRMQKRTRSRTPALTTPALWHIVKYISCGNVYFIFFPDEKF